MRISVTVVDSDVQVSQDFATLEVFPDMTLEAVKGFVQEETQIPPSAQNFVHNGRPIANTNQTLTALGINEGDLLSLIVRANPQASHQRQQPRQQNAQRGQGSAPSGMPDAETLRLQILNDQGLLAQVQERDPDLAGAVHNSDAFRQLFEQRQQAQADSQREKEQAMALLDSDPFNAEAQGKIEEIIRQERVMENMKKALEENPESFGRVIMLYIDVTVNNTPIKAFVDSGAQTTIMSPDAAEKCGIMRLIDRRYGGIARGVGTAKILGRVHSADIQIGQYSLASSFTVMEGKGVDLLLGLDMLKRHQMSIDLKDNVLRIQTDTIPFLSENEIPRGLDEALEEEPTVQGPGNTEIGATTGTVKSAGESSSSSSQPPAGASRINIHPQGSAGNVFSNRPPAQAQAPPAASQAPPRQAPTGGLPTGVTEEKLRQITDLGFGRQEAMMVLQQAQGNVELAISLLL